MGTFLKSRKRNIIYRQTLADEFGWKFTVVVPVTVTDYWFDGIWNETFDADASDAIDRAVEKIYPGWFHRCIDDAKGLCPACDRKRTAKILGLIA